MKLKSDGCWEMSIYRYESIDPVGNKKIGAIVAEDKREAYKNLLGKNVQPTKLRRQYFLSKEISTEDILLFFLHVSFQLKCGARINESIDTFIDFHGNDALNATLLKVSEDLKNGEKISTAFEKNCKFNPIIIGLLKAAEKTGCLTETISGILNLLQLQANWKNRIRGIIAYPAFIAIIAILILFVSSNILGPQVISLIKNYGDSEVPFLTKFAVDVLPILSRFFGIVSALLLGTIAAMMLHKRGNDLVLQITFSIPILSSILKKIMLWQMFEILHISYIAKLDFLTAFDLVLQTIRVEKMKKQMTNVRENIVNGGKISTSFSKVPYLPTDIAVAIFIGEEGNNLEQTFSHISEKVYADLVNKIKMLGEVLSVGLTLFTGLIFVFILCSLFQPIYNYVGMVGV